jgi:hypothetical protein
MRARHVIVARLISPRGLQIFGFPRRSVISSVSWLRLGVHLSAEMMMMRSTGGGEEMVVRSYSLLTHPSLAVNYVDLSGSFFPPL